jgi:hypothetical protein
MSEGVVTTTSVTILIEIANESRAGHSNILQMRSTTAASAGRRGSEYFPTVGYIFKPRVVTVGVFLLSGRDSGQKVAQRKGRWMIIAPRMNCKEPLGQQSERQKRTL